MKTFKEAFESAKQCVSKIPEGWEIVVFANRHKASDTRKVYGWNFQKIGVFQVGEVIENAWSGSIDSTTFLNVCEVVARIGRDELVI